MCKLDESVYILNPTASILPESSIQILQNTNFYTIYLRVISRLDARSVYCFNTRQFSSSGWQSFGKAGRTKSSSSRLQTTAAHVFEEDGPRRKDTMLNYTNARDNALGP